MVPPDGLIPGSTLISMADAASMVIVFSGFRIRAAERP